MKPTHANIQIQDATNQGINVHIDWIHIYAPCEHVPTGTLVYFDDKSVDHLVPTAAAANQKVLKDGGDEAHIRSKEINGRTGMASMIEIQCCPPKVLQNHNLFGHGDLQSYVYQILNLAAARLGIKVRPEDLMSWQRGDVSLTEIHLTANFGRPAGMSVPIIQAIDDNTESRKRKPLPSWIILDKGKKRRSTFGALTIYDKMLEMLSHREWRKPGPYQTKLLAEANRGIRAEIKIFSQGLKHYDLGYVNRWGDVDIPTLYFEYLDKYNLCHAVQRLLTDDELVCLTRSERNTYTLWLKGVDIKDQCSRTTAWKITKAILKKTGIDVSGKRRPEKLPDIDLRDIFTPKNVLPVPSWAFGTRCFVAPRGYGISNVPVDQGGSSTP
ncbi:hypothetical protein GCN74_26775 [Janthinobacterium sp. FT14W]|uniref:phage/plasmid replication domain-containing protein n=1 Tax=Janthinobacterium sp. FT14W TaxID=2654253 RepID=UPI001264ADB8|nr:phage/plasmid replication protein [Janthinobacterium sp. FT14W]KAB8050753.1 hypothetical protein GCN74_26775 [Janthinobacterium sp. FT14W]